MYEADDHLLFGDKFIKQTKKRNNKVSDTASRASRASSRSSQGSARRRKKKAKRRFGGMMGETGSDSAAIVTAGGHRQMGSSNGLDEPIAEHPGPKPNPTGNSLIEKMNHLMT